MSFGLICDRNLTIRYLQLKFSYLVFYSNVPCCLIYQHPTNTSWQPSRYDCKTDLNLWPHSMSIANLFSSPITQVAAGSVTFSILNHITWLTEQTQQHTHKLCTRIKTYLQRHCDWPVIGYQKQNRLFSVYSLYAWLFKTLSLG